MKHFYTFCLALFCIFSTNKKIHSSLVSTKDEERTSSYQPKTPSDSSPKPNPQQLQTGKRKRSEANQDLKARILEEHAQLRESILQKFCTNMDLPIKALKREIHQKICETSNRDDQYPLPDFKIPFNPNPDRITEYGLRRVFSYFGVHNSYIAIHPANKELSTEKIIISKGTLHIIQNFYNLSPDEQNAYLLACIFNLKNQSTQTLEAMSNQLEKVKENPSKLNQCEKIIEEYYTLTCEQAHIQALLTIATDPYHPLAVNLHTALATYKKIENFLNISNPYYDLEKFVEHIAPLTEEQKTSHLSQDVKSTQDAELALHTRLIINDWLKNITPPRNSTAEELPDCDTILNEKIDAKKQERFLDEWIEEMKKLE